MRLALALLFVVGCAAKKAGEPAAEKPDPVGAASDTTATAPPPPQSPTVSQATADEARERESQTGKGNGAAGSGAVGGGAPAGGPSRGAGGGSAIDQARASGVLGPTDQHAFAISGKVTIKSASTKQLDAGAKTNLDAVKACYDKALEYKDTLTGELTVSVKAGKATVAKSTLKNPELEKCVVEALTALPKSGKATLVLAFKRE
jgi:hypothetical protein